MTYQGSVQLQIKCATCSHELGAHGESYDREWTACLRIIEPGRNVDTRRCDCAGFSLHYRPPVMLPEWIGQELPS